MNYWEINTPNTRTPNKLTQPDAALLQALSTPIPLGVGQGAGVSAKLKSGAGSAKQGLGKLGNYFKNNFGWDAGSGVTAFGKNIGKGMNIASGALQVADAAAGLTKLSKARDRSKDISEDILLEAMQSPNVMNDLTTDQLELLRQLRSGDYEHGGGVDDIDLAGVLGRGGMGALTGLLIGGVPGAFIGGIGGAANSAIDDMAAGGNTDELQNLYVTLANANQNRRMARSGNVLPAVY